MSQTYVKSFTHLKDRPNAEKALPLLQRVASLVKPIMRKHGWVLPVLSEFFPESPNLVGLNINAGQKILLRLRPAHAPGTFFEEESIVLTMLHELTHNVHGPHDEKFYKFLSELEDEFEALKRSGYAGEGFFTKGRRLGENVSHNISPHAARLKALEAAERRRRVGNMLGGARRLGGAVPTRNLSPRELAAAAAERRASDELACASGAEAEWEAEKAARDSVRDEVIDLTGSSDTEPEVVILDEPLSSGVMAKVAAPVPKLPLKIPAVSTARRSTPARTPPSKRPTLPGSRRSHSRARPPRVATPPPSGTSSPIVSRGSPIPMNSDKWECPRCTLLNEPRTLQCAVCLLIRPEGSSANSTPTATPRMPSAPGPAPNSGWTCTQCGEAGMEHQFWSCRFCGAIKQESVLG